MKLKGMAKAIMAFVSKNERLLLTGVALSTEVIAILEALKEGPTFEKIREEIKERKENGEEVKKTEVVRKGMKPGLKVLIPLLISIIAQILNHKKASDEIASLANLLVIGRTASDEYKKQTQKVAGEETAEKIEDETARALGQRAYDNVEKKVYDTGHGTDRLYDMFSDETFLGDVNQMQAAVNDLNAEALEAWECSENHLIELSDVYARWGLPFGKQWRNFVFDKDTGIIRFTVTWHNDEDNRPIGHIKFTREPRVYPAKVRSNYG